jgi:hypothetical protein
MIKFENLVFDNRGCSQTFGVEYCQYETLQVFKDVDLFEYHLTGHKGRQFIRRFLSKEELDFEIQRITNSLNLTMFSDFLREVIFAMRRLEQIDRPPNPNTVFAALDRWHTAKDDGWEVYNTFMQWYWEKGKHPYTWAHQGYPKVVPV